MMFRRRRKEDEAFLRAVDANSARVERMNEEVQALGKKHTEERSPE
jgi:hypothetical protein